MGADIYCAICCGPFARATVGVEQRSSVWRQHHFRPNVDLDVVDQNLPGSAGARDQPGEGSNVASAPEDNVMDYVYSPDVILDEVENGQVRWVRDVYLIGFDGSRAAIFGPGSHDDFSYVNMEVDLDPFGNEQECWECYTDTIQQHPSYPFHKPCYDVLARLLSRDKEMSAGETERLYQAMRTLGEDCGVALDLDYRLEGQEYEQFWVVQRGKEYTVTSPAESPAVLMHLQSVLQKNCFRQSSVDDASTGSLREGQDLFRNLPREILHSIVAYLENDQLPQLLMASRQVRAALRHDNGFWRLRIQNTMAWFFELLGYLDHHESGVVRELDLKRVFEWANTSSKGCMGMKGPLMVVANRRRIWETACTAIQKVYHAKA
ncbi:uncharacterized protein B0I36DRAFT_330666 [Microdochium trichocladiopsis]|uniref:F-box domain-containing protein n=1 Tax=Microdochium trichocladiopsis TaxID=1682393 RepID=A0A9P9BN03_9PEZI|nr:uncharacterized protein B0I36DRAFT_330666 [Microdochium trichocladiopsis]KAH7026441.1 hypothetical protein B0I36DRAFT_330666 [Microdochium trichocladiopsis]